MESKGALLTVAIPLIAFKIWFAILLLSFAPNRDTVVWVAATHWPLLILLGFLVPPSIAGYRLLKARSKREQLRRAEFMVEERARVSRGAQCSALWETVSRLEGSD